MKRFSIVLLIRHPHIDPDEISNTLRLAPYFRSMAGDPRKTPRGTRLPGVEKMSTWNYIKEWVGDVSFSQKIEEFSLSLSENRDFILKLNNEGARCDLFVQLPGDTSQGDSLKPELLKIIYDLGLHLGFEVFPSYSSIVVSA